MFQKSSFINSVGEYAYDCMNRYDMLLRDETSDSTIRLITQYGDIIVTEDTLVATGRGLWKRADELYIGNSLKHYIMGHAVITGIEQIKEPQSMLKVIDCRVGYLIIEGLYISGD